MTRAFHEAKHGEIFWGDSRGYLFGKAAPESVDPVIINLPSDLVGKKSYGNEDAGRYCNWFRPSAEGCRRVLKESGSSVIDIGGARVSGQSSRGLYHFKLLIMLVEE